MAEEKGERLYPVRSLHDFLYELDREWGKFRAGSLLGIIVSGSLLVFFVAYLLPHALRRPGFLDVLFLTCVIILLVYSLYAMLVQYRFFSRWERRMGLLLHLEEELMKEKLGK